MGIGFNPKQRAPILKESIVSDIKPTALVVDVPACIRSSMTRDTTPMQLARQLLRQLRKQFGAFAHAEFYFDDSDKLHAKRQAVSLVRGSRAAALTEAELGQIEDLHLDTLSPAHLDTLMCWSLLLKSTKTKMICWALLARALFAAAIQLDVEHVKVAARDFVESSGTVTDRQLWGEADLSCAMAASSLTDVAICTIDYDMVLQALVCLDAEPSNVYVSFKGEMIDAGLLAQKYGSVDQRLHAAVLLLCAFKSDYSKPICRKAKMTTKELVEQMATEPGSECLVEQGEPRQLVFRPQLFKKCMRLLPDVESLDNILWCIAYFRAYDGARIPAGPPPVALPAELFQLDECVAAVDICC